MTTPLETTVEVLSATRNESAIPVLLAGLDSSDGSVYEGSLRALVARRNKSGHLAVLKRWHLLNPRQRAFVLEGRGRLSGGLRNAVLDDDDQLFANACELIEEAGEFDLVPTLVTLAENQKSPHAQAATELVCRMVDHLSALLREPRNSKDRRDPKAIRRYVLESLERSASRFREHQKTDLIEAFVTLGGSQSGLVRQILDDPHHACYVTVISTLTKSNSAGVIELLIDFLKCDFASLNILNVISKRTDPTFVKRLLEFVSESITAKVAKNLGRIRHFAWLQKDKQNKQDKQGIAQFDDEDQARCIQLISYTGIKQEEFLDLLDKVMAEGGPEGRLAACKSLTSIQGDRASHLVLKAADDKSPEVQAAAALQLRDRHLPGTMPVLLKLIDSPHEVVREATRTALSEFSFKNFLIGFDTLNDDARRSTAVLVKKVDPTSLESLQEEMASPSRKRRLRSIEMAEAMQLVPQTSEQLIELLDDEDHLARAAAADALQFCPTPEAAEALRFALGDKSGAVKHAATSSLAILEESTPAGFLSPSGDST